MKAWTIAWKDTLIRFRDRNALLLMLAAPLILSAITGMAFGAFNNTEVVPFSDIPVGIVNHDEGELGDLFEEILSSDELASLIRLQPVDDLQAARSLIEQGEARAVVYIPSGFSESLETLEPGGSGVAVEVLTDPTANATPNIVRSIVQRIASGISSAMISQQVAVDQALTYDRLLGPALANLEPALIEELGAVFTEESDAGLIEVRSVALPGAAGDSPSLMGFFAPSMAMVFLSFTMFDGTRSILDERRNGTLARIASTPTAYNQIILGKLIGVFLTGSLQLLVLIVASRLIFGLQWGRSVEGLLLMVFAVVAAYTGIGALIAGVARNIGQANVIGTTVALVMAVLGGNFFSASSFPDWLQAFSRMTINRWGMEGFIDLTMRQLSFEDVLLEAGVLIAAAVLLFIIATWRFKKLQFA